ncbi:MAG: hypothetical protein HQ506_03505 [Candidatus Marinimicrobia bacterium]|nr:hypothetical protein [Candidatus Neomarinimicrobiota bacterium]
MNLPFGFSLEANFNGDGYLFLLVLTIGSIFALLMNKPRKNKTSRSDYLLTWMIPAVRILALLTLLLLLFSPQLSLNRSYSIPKRLAVLLDQSSSMGNAWQGDIDDLQKSIAQTIKSLEKNTAVDVWSMGGQEISSGEPTFSDESSTFGWDPLTITGSETGDLYSAVFLFSDGHLNGGRSPLDMPWSKSLGVNVVYPLKPESNVSLKLIDVNYLVGEGGDEQILILGNLQQEGLFGRQATVQILTEMDQLLGEEVIQLNQSFQNIKLLLGKMNHDINVVKVRISLEGGEFLTEKLLEVIQKKTKKNVLIISERINTLHKFLVQSFSDSTFLLHIIQGTQRENRHDQAIYLPDNLDLIILNHPGDLAFAAMGRTTIDLDNYSAIPSILFYDGLEKLSPKWLAWLGVEGLSENSSIGSQVSYWSEISQEHPFYLGLLGLGYTPADLLDYAPIEVTAYSINAGGDQILMSGYGNSALPVLTISDQPPRAIFSGSGFWKWFFHPHSKQSYHMVWDYLLLYLEQIASFNPVQIDIPVRTAATGAYIESAITIKDLDNRIIRAAELRVWQEDESGMKTTLSLTRDDQGIYRTQLDTKYPGKISIFAEAYRYGELWGRDTSRIHLMSFNGEDQSRGVDEVFLSRLASRSGGQVIQIGKDELPNIPTEMVERESSYQFRGVRSPYLFTVLFLLLIFEWIWRRRSGLL